MKKLIALPLVAMLAVPAIAGTTKTTTTRTYDETTTSPVMGSDMNSDAEMIEAEEESFNDSLDSDRLEQERMEERMEERNQNSSIMTESDDEDVIDYSDRTRTNRERKALNTGSHASDDE